MIGLGELRSEVRSMQRVRRVVLLRVRLELHDNSEAMEGASRVVRTRPGGSWKPVPERPAREQRPSDTPLEGHGGGGGVICRIITF